jgi:hypothetical protein
MADGNEDLTSRGVVGDLDAASTVAGAVSEGMANG